MTPKRPLDRSAWRLPLATALLAFAATACDLLTTTPMEAGNSEPGTYSYCGALTASCNKLYAGTQTTCSEDSREQCEAHEPGYSAAYRAAVVSCAETHSPCIADFHTCINDRTWEAVPTEAQAKVREAFCAVCPDQPGGSSVGPCSTFFTRAGDGGAPGVYQLGYSVLLVSDAVAEEIARTCLDSTATKCDVFAFVACAATVRTKATLPASCSPDSG